jgi:hypothetical protein
MESKSEKKKKRYRNRSASPTPFFFTYRPVQWSAPFNSVYMNFTFLVFGSCSDF